MVLVLLFKSALALVLFIVWVYFALVVYVFVWRCLRWLLRSAWSSFCSWRSSSSKVYQ